MPGEKALADTDQPQRLLALLMHDYAHGASALVWSGGLVELMYELGFSRPAARMALSRLVRGGGVERVRQGRFVHYALSARARLPLELQDRRVQELAAQSADVETWTVAWHLGPQDTRPERTRLTRLLRPLGFATLHAGVWIAPGDRRADLADLLRGAELRGRVSAIAGASSDRALAPAPEQVWAPAGLADRYRALCERWAPLAADGRVPADAEAFALRVRLAAELRATIADDPGLPLAERAEADPRARAIAVSRELAERLRAAAQRHFDAASTAWMRRPLPDAGDTADATAGARD